MFSLNLLELLLVLTVSALLAVTSLKSSHHLQQVLQKKIIFCQLEQALNFAKQAAIANHQSVSVCAADSDKLCGHNWAKGILIFVNPKNQPSPEENQLLLRIPLLAKDTVIIWHGWLNDDQLRFAADGLPHGYQGTFYSIQLGQKKVLLILNAFGRIRSQELT